MGCDYYIRHYLYVYFENKKSNIPILLDTERCYFYDNGEDDDDYNEKEIEEQLTPCKPILIYSNNDFINMNFKSEYKDIIQKQLDIIDKKWENISIIRFIETRSL
jgi:hypothetical protein